MGNAVGRIDAEINSSSDSIWGKGEYRIRGFGSAVDSAIRSRTASNSDISSVHGFGSAVDNDIRSTTASIFETQDSVRSFGWVVDNEMSSTVWPNSPPLYGFASAVDHAIGSNVGAEAEAEAETEGIDGGFDRIFRSLGLSGPEDFAIPAAAWKEAQAQKARSTMNLELEPSQNKEQREGGIKGVRRPPLELTQVVTSTWTSQQPTERDSLFEAEIEEVSALVGNETFDIHNLSPNVNGYFRSWLKGEVLGSGSFGTVYEGFTE